MRFDSLLAGDFETFDDIFDQIASCLDKNFGLQDLIATGEIPSFMSRKGPSVLYVHSLGRIDTSYNVVLKALQSEPFTTLKVHVEGLDESYFAINLHFMTNQEADEQARNRIVEVGKIAFSKCLERKIAKMRDSIVTMSFQTRDIGSFLHKAVVIELEKYIKFEGTSVFYYDYQSDFLSLGSTTGLRVMREEGVKRTDIKYDRTSRSRVRSTFHKGQALYEDKNFGDKVPRNTYGEDIETLRNRLYVPIDVRSNLKNKLTDAYGAASRTDGKVGLLRIVNIKRNGTYGPLSDIDFHLLEYFCEYVAVLGARYIKVLSVVHDQEKATHGFITDLSTMKLQSQLFEMQIQKATDSAPRKILEDHPNFLSNLQAQTEIFLRNLLSVQDGMAFQIATVLQHTEGAIGYSAEDDGQRCDKPYVQVLMRILDARNGICGTYNRKPAKISLGQPNQTQQQVREMPALAAPRKTVYLAVRNVVENSIKYTPRERVPDINVSWSVSGGSLRIDISDRGIGIGKDDQGKIFDEGFRSRRAMRTSLRGHGLGLSVSRSGIRSFGGEISYLGAGPGGEGARFRVTIPIN